MVREKIIKKYSNEVNNHLGLQTTQKTKASQMRNAGGFNSNMRLSHTRHAD